MDVKVSVVVPIYKVEKYLDRCVQSILNQTYKNLEIILVDDGSPDNCPAMCDRYAEEDSRVIVLHKENGGLSNARNTGMEVATGKYLLFVDSDDWIEPETVEKLTDVAEESDVDFVRFRAVWDGRNGIPDGTPCSYESSRRLASGYYDRERMKKEIFPRLFITHDLFMGPILAAWAGFYKREFLNEKNISFENPVKYSEDSIFSARVVFESESFVVIDDYFYHYCFNLGSISFGKHKDWWEVAKLRSVYFEKYFGTCDEFDFTEQLKRVAIFNVLDGLSEWKRCENDSQKLEEIRMVFNDDFTGKAMKNIAYCKVPFKKWIMLYLIKFRMVRIYFWIFNKE